MTEQDHSPVIVSTAYDTWLNFHLRHLPIPKMIYKLEKQERARPAREARKASCRPRLTLQSPKGLGESPHWGPASCYPSTTDKQANTAHRPPPALSIWKAPSFRLVHRATNRCPHFTFFWWVVFEFTEVLGFYYLILCRYKTLSPENRRAGGKKEEIPVFQSPDP